MRIVTKHPGYCSECKKPIPAGESVEWFNKPTSNGTRGARFEHVKVIAHVECYEAKKAEEKRTTEHETSVQKRLDDMYARAHDTLRDLIRKHFGTEARYSTMFVGGRTIVEINNKWYHYQAGKFVEVPTPR